MHSPDDVQMLYSLAAASQYNIMIRRDGKNIEIKNTR
jgi:hypothetical protein